MQLVLWRCGVTLMLTSWRVGGRCLTLPRLPSSQQLQLSSWRMTAGLHIQWCKREQVGHFSQKKILGIYLLLGMLNFQ
jgi:hypothetical protein